MNDLEYAAAEIADRLIDLIVLDSASYASATARSDLYFIQVDADGPIKIGIAADVHKRLAALQTANPYSLHLIGHMPGLGLVERTLHTLFNQVRLAGEWFKPVPEVVAAARGQFPESVLNRQAPRPLNKPWRYVTGLELEHLESTHPAAAACPRWSRALEWWHFELKCHPTVESALTLSERDLLTRLAPSTVQLVAGAVPSLREAQPA